MTMTYTHGEIFRRVTQLKEKLSKIAKEIETETDERAVAHGIRIALRSLDEFNEEFKD